MKRVLILASLLALMLAWAPATALAEECPEITFVCAQSGGLLPVGEMRMKSCLKADGSGCGVCDKLAPSRKSSELYPVCRDVGCYACCSQDNCCLGPDGTWFPCTGCGLKKR